jgi:hypothetical protein
MSRIDLVLYKISSCEVCRVLAFKFSQISSLEQFREIVISYCNFARAEISEQSSSEQNTVPGKAIAVQIDGLANPELVLSVRPRAFPTVIAFVDGAPKAGWEGFAMMAPQEIQDASIHEVLQSALNLISNVDSLDK